MTVLAGVNRVRATAWITAGTDGSFPRLRSQAPLVLRPTRDAVYLVSAGGGPVGGDALELRIEVRTGAALRLRTVAASVALPGVDGAESVLAVRASVAHGGVLEYLPEPMVVADNSRHTTDIQVDLAAGATLVVRDEIILGRHGERGGACRTRLRCDYGGRPLLRHDVVVDGTDEVSLGPAVLAGHRAYGTVLRAGESPGEPAAPDARATATPGRRGAPGASLARPNVAVMPLAGPGVLVSALAADSLTLRRLLDDFGERGVPASGSASPAAATPPVVHTPRRDGRPAAAASGAFHDLGSNGPDFAHQ